MQELSDLFSYFPEVVLSLIDMYSKTYQNKLIGTYELPWFVYNWITINKSNLIMILHDPNQIILYSMVHLAIMKQYDFGDFIPSRMIVLDSDTLLITSYLGNTQPIFFSLLRWRPFDISNFGGLHADTYYLRGWKGHTVTGIFLADRKNSFATQSTIYKWQGVEHGCKEIGKLTGYPIGVHEGQFYTATQDTLFQNDKVICKLAQACQYPNHFCINEEYITGCSVNNTIICFDLKKMILIYPFHISLPLVPTQICPIMEHFILIHSFDQEALIIFNATFEWIFTLNIPHATHVQQMEHHLFVSTGKKIMVFE